MRHVGIFVASYTEANKMMGTFITEMSDTESTFNFKSNKVTTDKSFYRIIVLDANQDKYKISGLAFTDVQISNTVKVEFYPYIFAVLRRPIDE